MWLSGPLVTGDPVSPLPQAGLCRLCVQGCRPASCMVLGGAPGLWGALEEERRVGSGRG